jgi:hypothetical protein
MATKVRRRSLSRVGRIESVISKFDLWYHSNSFATCQTPQHSPLTHWICRRETGCGPIKESSLIPAAQNGGGFFLPHGRAAAGS